MARAFAQRDLVPLAAERDREDRELTEEDQLWPEGGTPGAPSATPWSSRTQSVSSPRSASRAIRGRGTHEISNSPAAACHSAVRSIHRGRLRVRMR